MGEININLHGSFGTERRHFSAMGNGHAAAVAKAIQYLSEVVLPAAIRNDHDLHEAGCKPEGAFGHD